MRGDTHTQFDVPPDPNCLPGDFFPPYEYGITPEPFGDPGGGNRHLAAYSYRLPPADIEGNINCIYKPEGDNPLTMSYTIGTCKLEESYLLPRLKGILSNKPDLIGSEAVLATDLLGMDVEWPTANTRER
ncbi:hypothetical protein BDV36DRAFT_291436 [Aspergillus pseudocaelatus]|uniref:Uncharacterized protein n=1 Tax=Aspergillus pseudocaelatus TaxID=1825620 RepID=A0ABQ6WYZ4_9EURO|nr:hypothetical protein BDV36DRAFT_291436 [Aspergillus pseudocaelatus]